MLVLSRKVGEDLVFRLGADLVVVRVVRLRLGRVALGVQAPDGVTVLRRELVGRRKKTPMKGSQP